MNSEPSVAKADCIVVLGAGVWPGGVASPVLGDRLLRAAELYKEGIAGKIICSGGVGRYPPSEAEVGRAFLIKSGIPAEDILLESATYSTIEQAKQIKAICDSQGFRSIALVTSFFHGSM